MKDTPIMSAEGNELQYILDSVARLGTEVEESEPGAPELAVVVAAVIDLQGRLERVRSVMGPLVPDANSEPSLDEKAAVNLERALTSLLSAARARQSVG
jgi:hypothetical protein